MAYSEDLIEQARHLVELDRTGRPKQVNIRRAVSAAYYAVFHEVIEKAVSSILSVPHASGGIGARVRRTVSHASVLKASKWYATGNLPDPVKDMRAGGNTPVSSALKGLCLTIVDLQSSRHMADYDLSENLDRQEAQRLISSADAAVKALRTLTSNDADTMIFLLGVLFGDNLTRNA